MTSADQSNQPIYHDAETPFRYYLLIPNYDPSSFFVLLEKTDDDSWRLPMYQPIEHHFAVVGHINEHVAEAMRLHVATLRCFRTDKHEEKGERRFYALDNLMPEWEPPENMQWFTEVDLLELTIETQLHRDVIMGWFDWRHSDHSQRVAWNRPSWYINTANWMLDIADRMAMTGLQAPEQIRTWARSTTMRLDSNSESMYLKAVPSIFNYEPVVTRVLSIRYPQNTPAVVGVHVDNGWMLTWEWSGRRLTQIDDITIWEKAIRRYAKIQRDLVKSSQSLVALGVPDRNVDYLASQIQRLINDLPDTLSDNEGKQLKRIAPTLRGMCYELVDLNLPLTLTHGDFWAGNVVISDDEKHIPIFFDWSDASISHPFFDAVTFLEDVADNLPHVENAHDILLDAYLEEWASFNMRQNLRHAYALASVLAYLHQALFYYVHILPSIETAVRWELTSMPARQLQKVIRAMDAFQKRKTR
ncbi:MAG: phosphotransferase [Chloroflexota bacterium]